MIKIFEDQTQLKLYSTIQKHLHALHPKSREKTLNKIFDLFPADFLNQKENLLMISNLFANVGVNHMTKYGVVIKLFSRILPLMKIYLQDESSAIWNLTQDLFFLKLWFYEKGLISIQQIQLASLIDNSTITAQYFLPELIKNDPRFFYFEIKPKYSIFYDKSTYSKETIQKVLENRQKFFKWILLSNDRTHPIYREIETDPLRLAIKTDDIDSFQRIISESNISINSKIHESIIESCMCDNSGITLVKFAMNYNAIKIFKFLYMNNVEFDVGMISFAIYSRNYDIIHIVESNLKQEFERESLIYSITFWKQKVSRYIMNNYDYDFLREKNIYVDEEKKNLILNIIKSTFSSSNFRFFKSILLPFLMNNTHFLMDNLYEIIYLSLIEMSCFFLRELLKIPGIDINHSNENQSKSILTKSIESKNSMAVEHLLKNYENIDVIGLTTPNCPPLSFVCYSFADIKILKMFCQHPRIDINYIPEGAGLNVFEMSFLFFNPIAASFFVENFKNKVKLNPIVLNRLQYNCLINLKIMTLRILVKFLMETNDKSSRKLIIRNARNYFLIQNNYSDDIWNVYTYIFNDLGYDINDYLKKTDRIKH